MVTLSPGWLSKKPVIFRATTQWFVAMEPENAGTDADYRLRERALETIDTVNWVPAWGRDRIYSMVEGRPDWCISRQRSWGVPITVMHCDSCGEALATQAIAEHVADLIEEHGADVWFERPPEELVPEGTVCPSCGSGPETFRKEEDILDVWFDSGVSWSAVLDAQLGIGDQADLYLEGSDQHRGWFQSSLLCSLLSRDQTPYHTCLTHGFVIDDQGRKYSKSSKNYEAPEKMLNRYGAEILRMWVASVDYRGDITLSDDVLKVVVDAYRKVRNSFRFLLGNLEGFVPSRDAVAYEELEELDRWMLHRVGQAVVRIGEAFESYQFHTIFHTLVQLMTVDLSNVYLDVTKDRMYCESPTGTRRRAGQTTYFLVLDALVRAVAPILSFTAEEVWSHMPERASESVFLSDFPSEAADWVDEELGARWEGLLALRGEVQRALEAKRVPKKQKKPGQIGSSQEAELRLVASGSSLELLRGYEERLSELFIVSAVELVEGSPEGELGLDVEVRASQAGKCLRCWNHWLDVGVEGRICRRCAAVLA